MQLNTLSPAPGARKERVRVGRGRPPEAPLFVPSSTGGLAATKASTLPEVAKMRRAHKII